MQHLLISLYCTAVLLGGVTTAIPLDDFFPFGGASNDFSLPSNDDGFTARIILNLPFPYFNSRQTSVFVNNNGILSFGAGVSSFTPDSFPLGDGRQIIAPFWGDVDTRGTGNVWYRETDDASLLARARSEIQAAFVSQMSFEPTGLFIATWDRVGYYNSRTDLTNTFQSVLITNGRRSFVIFNYADGEIQWTTGDASDGIGGFGGTPAQVGFNAGDGIRFADVPGSQTADIVNIDTTSNVERPGVWIFRVDEEEVEVIGECTFNNNGTQSVPLQIGPQFGNLLGGTAIHLSGPCFNTTVTVNCTFEGAGQPSITVTVIGIILNNRTAICVSPSFPSVGWKDLSVILIEDGVQTYTGSNRFYAADPRETDEVILEQETILLVQDSGDVITVQWEPLSLLPLVDPNLYTVNIDLFRVDAQEETWVHFLNVTSGIPNNGSSTFTVPLSGLIEAEVYAIALRVSVGAAIGESSFGNVLQFAQNSIFLWMSDLYYTTSTQLFQVCLNWYLSEPSNIGPAILSRVPNCCETEDRAAAPNSGFVRDGFDRMVTFFHPGAANCYRQATILSDNMGSGQQCCYTSDGNLLVGPFSGGTVNLVAPTGSVSSLIQHQIRDVIPAIYCCQGTFRESTCGFYYLTRPSGGAETCDPPQPAFFFGDPHIVTLDGFRYTFNGLGEFDLIQTMDDSFTFQGRMIQAEDVGGTSISATAFSAIVAKQSDSDTIQFQLLESEIIIDEIEALVNGELIDFEGIPDQQFNNVVLQKTDNAISAVFIGGVSIAARVENGIISLLSVTLPLSYTSQTSGLMGNYNGDTSDDILPRGASIPISTESSTEDIHNLFGITWIIDRPEDSLFTYRDGEDWSTFYNPNFIPVFEPTFTSLEAQQEAESICGDDIVCIFDVAVTGRPEIGMATLQGNMAIERINNISQPVVCDPPCENGVCVANDTCSCSEGFSGATCNETDVVGECVMNVCQNGGSCSIVASSAVCTCPPEWTGALCEVQVINPCPPYCAMEFCSQAANRKSLCTIPNPTEDFNCTALCRVTYCHACYYYGKEKPIPEHCDIYGCPSYPDYTLDSDRICLKHWATCTRLANPLWLCGKHEKIQERFRCFEHPCL